MPLITFLFFRPWHTNSSTFVGFNTKLHAQFYICEFKGQHQQGHNYFWKGKEYYLMINSDKIQIAYLPLIIN